MKITLSYDIDAALKLTEQRAEKLRDWRSMFRQIQAYMIDEIGDQFEQAGKGKTGGRARGKVWKPFAPQYTRRDGTVVPAWGGIDRLDGKGKVKGRLRGKTQFRVTESSLLMRNIGTMYGNMLLKASVTNTRLSMTTADIAKKVARQNDLRPHLFFAAKDVEYVERAALRHVESEK